MKISKLSTIVAALLTSPAALPDTLGDECQNQVGNSSISTMQSLERAGNAESQFQLGRHYEYGICVDQDDSIAINWYMKAGTKGSAKANYRLGVLYDNGWGVDVDAERAVSFYTVAAIQNHAMAQYDLAMMYFEGAGVEQDPITAYTWLLIAINSGHEMMREQLMRVAKKMTADEIVTAESYAAQWISQQQNSDPDLSG